MSTLLKSLSIHPGENLDTSKIQNQKNSKYILELWCRLVELNLTKIHTSCSKFTDSLLLYFIISKEYIVLPLSDLILSSTNPEIKKSVCCYYLQVFFFKSVFAKFLWFTCFFKVAYYLHWKMGEGGCKQICHCQIVANKGRKSQQNCLLLQLKREYESWTVQKLEMLSSCTLFKGKEMFVKW